MTIKKHILNYLKYLENSGIFVFKTSDIQNLSQSSEKVFGRILGSPSTYERTFRQLRQDNILVVNKRPRKPKQNQTTWVIKEIK